MLTGYSCVAGNAKTLPPGQSKKLPYGVGTRRSFLARFITLVPRVTHPPALIWPPNGGSFHLLSSKDSTR